MPEHIVTNGNNNVSGDPRISQDRHEVEAMFGDDGTIEASQKHYENWAATYDTDTVPLCYDGPRMLAGVLQKLAIQNNNFNNTLQTLRLLDVGCGTGILGVELRALGFANIDGLDPSAKMLEKAREKGLYGKLYEAYVGTPDDDDFPVADIRAETYDIVSAAGAFIYAHIPAEGLRQVLKLVKKKTGLVALIYRPDPLNENERQYISEMRELQQSMMSEGLMEIVYDETVEKYVKFQTWFTGRIAVFRRLN